MRWSFKFVTRWLAVGLATVLVGLIVVEVAS